jgi:hypothetical protein
MFRKLIIFFLSIYVIGCAPKFIDGITTADKNNAAVILGEGGEFGETFAFLTTSVTGSRFDTEIMTIDGHKVSATDGGREWWLVPGEHTLTIGCSHKYASISEPGKSDFAVSVEGGHIYQLKSRPKSRPVRSFKLPGCETTLTDVTDKQQDGTTNQ